RGPRWALRRAIPPPVEVVVRLLPAFDEYLLGWKDRQLIASASRWKTIQRGGGWLHPVVLVDGRAFATWTSERTADGLRVDVSATYSRRRSSSSSSSSPVARSLGMLPSDAWITWTTSHSRPFAEWIVDRIR